VISSPDNARVKELVSLRSSGERRRRGLFVAEGPREVERAAAAGLRVLETFYAPALLDWPGGQAVSERVLAKMAYRAKPEGVVALVEAPRFALPPGGSLYLVAVGIEKPGNLGAIARSAEAAGADALLVAEGKADPFNPNAIRASTGAVFTLPVVEASLEQVAGLGVAIVAAVVGAATRYSAADLARPVAIVVGAEDRGLPQRWREAAETELSIPLAPGRTTESLNAAVAAAILLFEAVRQRA
jgi:TrmH family RNA methyltransferase